MESREMIKKHLQESHGIDFSCKTCEFKAFKKQALKKHEETHKPVSERSYKFPCDNCNYIAGTPMDLKRHLAAIHVKIKDKKCELCSYVSSVTKDLKDHMKIKQQKGSS